MLRALDTGEHCPKCRRTVREDDDGCLSCACVDEDVDWEESDEDE